MYVVTFYDEVQGEQVQEFITFDHAAEYWQDFADTPTCYGGKMVDTRNNETIWEFAER